MKTLNYNDFFKSHTRNIFAFIGCLILLSFNSNPKQEQITGIRRINRERISINEDWRFYKYDSVTKADELIYDVRPEVRDYRDDRPADTKPTKAEDVEVTKKKVFGYLERNPFVEGEFVWTGWDYLGEPTPYYESCSSYSGIIDLAGFKKDRFYIYQTHWRPELPLAHILPHWNWPERIGEVTPVHVFTSGDEAELFLNGRSLGRKKKSQYEYRLRWDKVKYEPGELKVVA